MKYKATQKDFEKTYEYYSEISRRIPNSITEKLSKLPNNKGIIWKGMYLYGELPIREDDNIFTMFERKNDLDTTYIHEWKDGMYRVYDKKVLIREEKRKLPIINEIR